MVSTALERRGQKLTDRVQLLAHNTDVRNVVAQAYYKPFATKSNFAKDKARFIAVAASMGLITVEHPHGGFDNYWRVTYLGVLYLEL